MLRPVGLELHGIRLIGLNSGTGTRLLLTLLAIAIVLGARFLLDAAVRVATSRRRNDRLVFWTRQGSSLAALAIILLAAVSIWFDNPARVTTAAGFATAGLAIAAQRAVTAFAGYLIIMRGKTFTVGDRIKMGGVRGDVIALGFLQTRILEMGQPANVNEQEDPGMWVRARQFSGRVVTVTNDKIFDEPVYNFTRELPFIWEEMSIPVPYRADHGRAEHILLEAARDTTSAYTEESAQARRAFELRYDVRLDQGEPRVYWRLTDNWVEMTVRFIVPEHGVREIKDAIARRILTEFGAAQIEIASATFELLSAPTLHIAQDRTSDQ